MKDICAEFCIGAQLAQAQDEILGDSSDSEFDDRQKNCPGPIVREFKEKATGRLLGKTVQCTFVGGGQVESINQLFPAVPHNTHILNFEELMAEKVANEKTDEEQTNNIIIFPSKPGERS